MTYRSFACKQHTHIFCDQRLTRSPDKKLPCPRCLKCSQRIVSQRHGQPASSRYRLSKMYTSTIRSSKKSAGHVLFPVSFHAELLTSVRRHCCTLYFSRNVCIRFVFSSCHKHGEKGCSQRSIECRCFGVTSTWVPTSAECFSRVTTNPWTGQACLTPWLHSTRFLTGIRRGLEQPYHTWPRCLLALPQYISAAWGFDS